MGNIGHNNPPLDPREAIEKNIERKKPILDRDPQFYNEVPLPSWIELSLIDVCNRSCSFCPKSDHSIAPDTYNRMENALIEKLIKDLKKINFKLYLICNPTNLHFSTLTKILKKNANIFVEKPLASNLRDLHKIRKYYNDYKINFLSNTLGFLSQNLKNFNSRPDR